MEQEGHPDPAAAAAGQAAEVPAPESPVPAAAAENTDSAMADPSSAKRKFTSAAWDVFDLVKVQDPKDRTKQVDRAKCKQCNQLLASQTGHGTSSLLRHIDSCSRKLKIDQAQTRIGRLVSGGITNFQFTQAACRRSMLKMVIMCELPFQFIEDPVVQRCINEGIQPHYRRIARSTIRLDVLKCYQEEKHVLRTLLLDCPGKISFTSDLWQSKQNLSYMSLTAHFIDKDWVLHKKILAYTLIDKAHTGENIAELINRKISDWGLVEKVFCLSLDNASSNTVSIGRLKCLLPSLPLWGELFHVRCCCHILNLVVQDGLKVDKFKEMLQHLKANIEYIVVSATRFSQFRSLCCEIGLKPKKLQLDVKHRWNSTYIMLRDVIPYRQAVTNFLTDRACPFKLTDDDWKYAELLCKFLKPFYDATNYFSGVNYVTSNSVLMYLFKIGKVFEVHRKNKDFEVIINVMEAKFVKYWGETPILFGIACILDPRVNLNGVEKVLNDLEDCFSSSSHVIGCSASQSCLFVSKLRSLFTEYTSMLQRVSEIGCSSVAGTSNGGGGSASAPPSVVFDAGIDGDGPEGDDFWSSISSQASNPLEFASEELARYFAEPKPSGDLASVDILGWWKSNGSRYPVLSSIARDVLAVPVSTVASESAFSCGKRVLGDYRSCLTPDMLECCVVLKDWWKEDMKDIYKPYDPLNEDITPVEEIGYLQS